MAAEVTNNLSQKCCTFSPCVTDTYFAARETAPARARSARGGFLCKHANTRQPACAASNMCEGLGLSCLFSAASREDKAGKAHAVLIVESCIEIRKGAAQLRPHSQSALACAGPTPSEYSPSCPMPSEGGWPAPATSAERSGVSSLGRFIVSDKVALDRCSAGSVSQARGFLFVQLNWECLPALGDVLTRGSPCPGGAGKCEPLPGGSGRAPRLVFFRLSSLARISQQQQQQQIKISL